MNNDRLALALLLDASIDLANEQIASSRRAAQSARRTARDQASQRRRGRVRSVAGAAFVMLLISVPVWALIPVVGSFVSIASDNFTKIVFLGSGEDGATAAGGPETLYLLLLWLIPGTILFLAVCGILLPYPNGEEIVSRASASAFIGGCILLLYQGFAGSGSALSWWWPAILACGAHLGYGLILQNREASGKIR